MAAPDGRACQVDAAGDFGPEASAVSEDVPGGNRHVEDHGHYQQRQSGGQVVDLGPMLEIL
jgi:hypothetical protein